MAKIPPRSQEDMARQWRSLAERKRQHLAELYRTGRWRRYYTEEEFLAQVRDAARTADAWDALARSSANGEKAPS